MRVSLCLACAKIGAYWSQMFVCVVDRCVSLPVSFEVHKTARTLPFPSMEN